MLWDIFGDFHPKISRSKNIELETIFCRVSNIGSSRFLVQKQLRLCISTRMDFWKDWSISPQESEEMIMMVGHLHVEMMTLSPQLWFSGNS